MISTVIGVVTLVYLFAGLLFVGAALWQQERLNRAACFLLFCGLAAHLGAFAGRWVQSYQLASRHAPPEAFTATLRLVVLQVPLSNFFESLVFFSLALPSLGLLSFRRHLRDFLGAMVALLACLILAYASLGADASIKPLMPALKSNWLLIHVLTAFLGYAAFGLAFGAALLYLWQARPTPVASRRAASAVLHDLDRLIYQAVAIGFIFLTLGILTGAVWADQAWGRYWSWDPKETWSLITWFIYAGLLHARLVKGWAGLVKGWAGKRIAWLAVLGFLAVLFTYFGVSFLLSGLHSYLT
ncbi:MAG: c-type cytochrome biogenesis protein CcsB [Deltaproteobacteria bacterium]|nr:c-type cytochrome biogenesis protein CcsB [Deltaproteobacteria bacterium]